MTGFSFDPFTIGSSFQLRVSFINERDETVNVKGFYCAATVDDLPDPKTYPTEVSKLEDQMWECVQKAVRGQTAISNSAPPKVPVSVPDPINQIVTQDFLDKLNQNAGIFVAGMIEDSSGRLAPVPYCVLLDKNRIGQVPTLCHSHN